MDKKKQMIVGGAVGALLLALVAGYLIFGGGGKDEQALRDTFGQFTIDLSKGNKDSIANLVSKKFNDAGLDYNGAVDEFGNKRVGYMAEIKSINITDVQAEVSYTRKMIVNKKLESEQISGETWVKEDDGKWRLVKLSAFDRTNLPKVRQARKEAEDKLAAELKAAEDAEMAARNVSYSSAGKRDPFESLIVEGMGEEGATAADDAHKCDPGRPRQYLEGFDLYSFKLVGVVQAGKSYYALVEAPNGNGYTLKEGLYIGRRCGKITRITAEKVVVAEKFTTPRGEFTTKDMELKLKEEE